MSYLNQFPNDLIRYIADFFEQDLINCREDSDSHEYTIMEEDPNWTGEYPVYSGDNSDSHEYTIMEEDPNWTGEYPHYSWEDSSLSDDFQ